MSDPARDASGDLDELTLELLDRYEEINLLYDIGGTLAGVFDVEVIGRAVVDRAMAVTRATGGLFLLLDGEAARVAYRAGEVPDEVVARLATGGDLLPRVLATPLLIQQPVLGVRVQRHGDVFGAIVLTAKRDDSLFSAGDGRLLQALAEQTATAIHTERLVRELRLSERMRSEMAVARRLQMSLLPARAPRIPGLDLAGTCQPSGHVGGDYFDFFALPDGRLGIVVADVSGHGVGSAIVMAGLRSTLYAEVRDGAPPSRVLARANAALARDFPSTNLFVSAFLATYEPGSGTLAYSNAGHPPALLACGEDDRVLRLEEGGLLLGIQADADYAGGLAYLDPGAVLAIYTDGITEARKPGGAFFGEAALRRVVHDRRGLGAAGVHGAVLAAVSEHLGGASPDDDVTLVVAGRPR